jgi:large subunit ribosomal protein L25
VGVKIGGGNILKTLNEIEISCLPKDLPEYLEVDMIEVELGDSVHISDITLPEGVTSIALSVGEENDLSVASVQAPRGISEEEGDSAAEDASGEEAGDSGKDQPSDGTENS